MNLTSIQIENINFLNLDLYDYNETTKIVSEDFISEIAEKLNKEFGCFNSVSEVARTFNTTFKYALLNLHFIEDNFKDEFSEELGFVIERNSNLNGQYYLSNY